jgi:hypothetical protein
MINKIKLSFYIFIYFTILLIVFIVIIEFNSNELNHHPNLLSSTRPVYLFTLL